MDEGQRAPLRVLVTGSRDWTDLQTIDDALRAVMPIDRRTWSSRLDEYVVIHGACPTGADAMADAWCGMHRVMVEPHPADWVKLGKRAGFVRNAEMVAAGADVCLAFIRNNSKGATMTARLAEQASIPVRRFTE